MSARGSKTHAARTSSQVTPRESAASSFTAILGETVARIAGAYSAILVDADGESVDYAGTGDPFDTKVAAAHIRILIQQIGRPSTGALLSLNVRGSRTSFVARVLPDGYALVILLRPRASLLISERATGWATWAIAQEAGWKCSIPEWIPCDVETDDSGRPLLVRSNVQMTQSTNHTNLTNGTKGSLYRAEVIGTVRGLPPKEVGYRVRLENEVETTLVREKGGRWYADVDVETAESRKPPSVRPPAPVNRTPRVRESARKHREK